MFLTTDGEKHVNILLKLVFVCHTFIQLAAQDILYYVFYMA